MKRKIKKIVRKIDIKIFKGELKKTYLRFCKNRKKSFFGRKKTAIVLEPVADMVLMQYNQNEYMQYQFYDLAVRYLAIENYYGKNDYGFELYKKMHTLGGNYGKNNAAEAYYKNMQQKNRIAKYGIVKEEHSIEQFEQLINSYEKNGYDESSVVMADVNLLSVNGSHRTALAVYRKQEFISVDIHNLQFRRRFNLEWFWQMGFSRDEIKLISDTTQEIIKECKKRIGDYYCILYPPAYEYFDEIVSDINEFDKENISVIDYEDRFLAEGDFVGLIRAIYSFDSISPHNFERKLFYILAALNHIEGKLPIRLVKMKIKYPIYRLKDDNGLPESINTVRLKEAIRGRYRVKDTKFTKHYVGDYAHDVIIHSTDNYISNKAVRLLLDIDRDITELFKILAQCDYCILETSVDKLSCDFPKYFYLNDDVDIFVDEKNLYDMSKLIEQYCKMKYSGEWMNVENIESDNGRRIRVVLRDCLIIMFDLMVKMPGLRRDYIKQAITRGSGNQFKHLNQKDEITVRLCKFIDDPQKKWHADFVRKHKDEYELDESAFVNPDHAIKILKKL